MALPNPVTIGPGWSVGPGWSLGVGQYYGQNTQAYQNVAGSNGATGFFFQGGSWLATPIPSYYDIAPGWTAHGAGGAFVGTVVSTDSGAQTVTIDGTFTSGATYYFTGI